MPDLFYSYLILIVGACGLALVFFNLVREIQLQIRGKISYENYHNFKKYYNFRVEKKILIISGIYVIVSLLLSFLILHNNVLKVYLYLLVSMIILVLISSFLYIDSGRYNRNLQQFDNYHGAIQLSYENKERISDNIDTLKLKELYVKDQIKKIESTFENLFKNYKTNPDINICLEPIKMAIINQQSLLQSFDNKMTKDFTVALNDYLKSGGVSNANNFHFNPYSNVEIDQIITKSLDILKEHFKIYILESFLKGEHKNSDALIEICEYLLKINSFQKSYVNLVLEYISKEVKEFENVLDYLFNKNLIDYDALIWCNEKNYEWVYNRPINSLLSVNQLVDLVVNIIDSDAINIANRFLILCDKNDFEYIKNALSISKKTNKTSILIARYIELLQLDGGFNRLSIRYESLALVLRYYYSKGDAELLEKIESIISQGTFLENKDLLDNLYNKELLNIEPILVKTFNSLLHYSLYGVNYFNEFSQDKINVIYTEYKKNLNIGGLLCLSALLDGIMLIYVTDNSQLDIIKNNIDSTLTNNQLFDDYYPITANKNGDAKLYGKDIIQNLFEEKYLMELRTILNHIEKDRLALDKIRFI